MAEIGAVIVFFVALILIGWARESLIERVAKPLPRGEERIDFPVLVTLTIGRNEIPWLRHSGVYDGIAMQRNQNALELRLVNTTNSRTIDPYSFFIPRDERVLLSLSKLLAQEAQRVEREGNPFFRRCAPPTAQHNADGRPLAPAPEGPMIAKDSILRRLPANMDRKQALFFDGIRHSAEIAAFAYGRLQETLTHIATGDHSSDDADRLYTSAFLDAWSIVDAIDRFRALWSAMPGASPAVLPSGQTTFAEITQPVRDLRNVADHLAQRAEYVVARRGSALGVLSWFTAVRPDGLEGLICTIVPGTLQHGSAKVVNPAGRIMELPTGMIHLSAGEHRACLSDVMPEMTLRVRDLEAGLERGVKDLGAEHPRSGSDLLVKMSVTFHPSSGKHSLSEGEA